MLVPHFIENVFRSGLIVVSSGDIKNIKFFLRSRCLLSPYRDYFKDTILFLQKRVYDDNVVIQLEFLHFSLENYLIYG